MAKRRNPNRGVVLSLADAHAIHRWLEYLMDDRMFWNPIEAVEAKRAATDAKARLEQKLIAQIIEHGRDDEAQDAATTHGCITEQTQRQADREGRDGCRELTELFSEFGTVEEASIPKDQGTGRSRGFGFVMMATDQEASRAIEALDRTEFQGRTILVNEAKPKEDRRSAPGAGRREARW